MRDRIVRLGRRAPRIALDLGVRGTPAADLWYDTGMNRPRPSLGLRVVSPHLRRLALACATSASTMLASCGGGLQMEPRYVALHNTMTALGLVQSGGLSQGNLSEGQESVTPVALQPGDCVTFVALGEGGVGDVDVIVRDEAGNDLARDGTADAQAATQFCPPYPGRFQVAVRMARGGGGYLAASWSGGPRGSMGGMGEMGAEGPIAPPPPPPHGGPGTCDEPWALAASERRSGNTASGDAVTSGTCIAGGTAPEHVYSFVVEQRSLVTAYLDSTFDGALYILGSCGETRSELGCNDDAPSTSHSEVSATLEPGTYYLVVDGFGRDSGDYEVSYAATPIQPPGALCRAATPLTPGQPISGTTIGMASSFEGSCAGAGADRVYTLDVAQPSRARVRMQSTHDGVVYVRSTCADSSTELACNDDFGDTRHSLATATLEPGRYFVFADGFSALESGPGAAGDYSIDVELAPTSGGAPGDTCTTALPYQPGQPVRVDTMRFADDAAGSCGGQGSPDVTYRLDLRSRTRIRATFGEGNEHPPVLYLQSTCGDARSELACVSAMSGGAFDQTVSPGTYFLVVDGTDANAFGVANVNLQLDDLGALEQACRSAPMLRPGTQVRADSTSSTDRFQASCGGEARSPELIYRLQIRRRSLVRLSSEQTGWDGVIYLRRDCLDAVTELGCNDDAGDNRHSLVETILEPGTYFVFVDGYAQGNQGPFTLDVDIQNP